jgi:hypothetical protein
MGEHTPEKVKQVKAPLLPIGGMVKQKELHSIFLDMSKVTASLLVIPNTFLLMEM